MPVPGLPNWGYGLVLDPNDMMERVFGPSKFARQEAMSRDTQAAAQLSQKEEQMRLDKAKALMDAASFLYDNPELQNAFRQQAMELYGINTGGAGQAGPPGLPPGFGDDPQRPPSDRAAKIAAGLKNMFRNPDVQQTTDGSAVTDLTASGGAQPRGGFEQIGNALVPDAVRNFLGMAGRGQPPARPQSVGEQSLAAQPLPQEQLGSLTQPPQGGYAEQLLQSIGSEPQQQQQGLLQMLMQEIMRQTQGR